MRGPVVLKSISVLFFTALCVVLAACATSEPVDDSALNGLTQEKAPTQPAEETKLPPSNPKNETIDAGTPKDSGSTPTDAGSTPKDSGSTTSTDCDPSDPTLILKAMLATNPSPCPCSAGQCCFTTMQICL